MSNPNAFVDNVSDLSPSRETLAAALSETVPQTITVIFQGGRVGLLSPSHPRRLVWAKRIESLKQRGRPVYVEIDPDTHTIIELLSPEISKVQGLTPNASGDVHVLLIPSPAPHYLLHGNPDFESMLKRLESAKAEGTAVLVTTARVTHEIIDVRSYDKAPDLTPLPAPPPEPAEAPTPEAPTPVTEQRAQELFDSMNARSCECSVVPPCIPFKYPTDGCYARAHEMCRLMFAESEQPEKVWIYASSNSNLNPDAPNDPDCQVSWWYHVAPTLVVSTGAGPEKRVIDPSLCTGPVTLDAWKDLQKDSGATFTFTDAKPFWPDGTTDDTYSLTKQYLQDRRDDLEDQCDYYGPPPYSCPIVKNCFFIVDRSSFGEDEIAARLAQGNPAIISAAFYVVVDGFTPAELGITANTFTDPPNKKPVFSIIPQVSGMTANPVHLAAEDPSHLLRRQRLTWVYQVEFSSTSGFTVDFQTVALSASISTVSASASLQLIRQPNPYEIDGQVSWLSTDLRVFQIKPGESKFASVMGNNPAAAPTFIQQVIANLNNGATGGQTFENDLSTDQQTSKLELSEKVKVNGTPTLVFNFAVARVRYRSTIKPAEKVRVFFRLFPASTTSLEYNPSTTYSRGGADGDVIPLLGVQGNELATIPCFATARVNSQTESLNQQKDYPNVQTLPADASGDEVVRYFGCWLDINQPSQPQFPIQPSPTDGPYPAAGRKTIQELIRSKHQCLVAEIAFDPDPIPSVATPGSSDKLAQRNLSIVESANPGDLASHRIPQTFEIRPTRADLKPNETPDELMIDWGKTPTGSLATLYLPGVSASEILKLAVGLYRSHRFLFIDEHTLRCPTEGITYLPIPPGVGANLAGMISVDLPPTVKKGQVFTIVVRQVTGGFAEIPVELRTTKAAGKSHAAARTRAWRRILGSFQITVPVLTKEVMLEPEERLLSNLRWIQRAIPHDNRWHPVFGRYVTQTANRVDALGGDSSKVKPSPSGEWQGIDSDVPFIPTWLMLGPIFDPSHQAGSHASGDPHPRAPEIIVDIDNHAAQVDPRVLTQAINSAPGAGDIVRYGGQGADGRTLFAERWYAWRKRYFAGLDWQSVSDVGDDIHTHLVGDYDDDPFDPYNHLNFAGKHHALALLLVYILSPDERTTRIAVRYDDALRLWLNGSEISRPGKIPFLNEHDIINEDETLADIHLKAGVNILLAAIAETHVEWGFSARIEDYEGLRFTADNPSRDLIAAFDSDYRHVGIAGGANFWNPEDPNRVLSYIGSGRWQGRVRMMDEPFKIVGHERWFSHWWGPWGCNIFGDNFWNELPGVYDVTFDQNNPTRPVFILVKPFGKRA